MSTSSRPRHARKEVRQLADWLDDHGWKYAGEDAKGHTLWTWPATGHQLKLPETPRGTLWMRNTRHEALKAMGATNNTKRRPKQYQPAKPHPGLVVTKAHATLMLQWVSQCTNELVEAAENNGRHEAAKLFRLYDKRLRMIIGE